MTAAAAAAGGGGSTEKGRDSGGGSVCACVRVCMGDGCWSGKIQFLKLSCSVCHHSLSRLNTRAE